MANVEEGETVTKRRHPTFTQNLNDYFTEYADNTTLHGMKFLGEQQKSWFEKLIWFIFITISLYICIGTIVQTYQKWETSPVIVSFAQSPTPVWQIPFPAVTICPETKAKQRVYNFTDTYHRIRENPGNMTDDERTRFEKVSLVCDDHIYGKGNETIGFETIDFLSEVAPQFTDVFWQCKWINQNTTCSELFVPVLTEEGVCYTFNMLDREELFTNQVFHNRDYLQTGAKSTKWTLEGGYSKDLGRDTYPRRAVAAGQGACLSVLMTLYDQDLDFMCRGPVQGFKILLHHPAEMPRVSQQYFRAPLDQEVVVAVKPDMMTTSLGLKEYDPHRRLCYFNWERQLRFFQVYSQRNCEVECLANFTLASCGCVAYHMPHDEGTEICGSGSVMCMKRAEVALIAREAELGIETFEEGYSAENVQTKKQCDCLPSCTSLVYNAEQSQADFNWPKVFQAFKVNFSEFPGVKMTRVFIFFKEQQFITSERNELYGLVDFLANCGGLLGLFIGFSFISVVEIAYFLTLRFMCNWKKFGRHYWSGSPALLNDDTYEH